MGNLVIGTSRLSDLATLTAGSEAASMPVTNLLNKQPGRKWRTAALTNTYVIADLNNDIGGYNFDGATDYLDANPLTGITDTKKISLVVYLRFAGAAAAEQRFIDNTGSTVLIRRTATGNIQFIAENAAGTVILSQATSGTQCAAAGAYMIMFSADLAVPGSAKCYINNTVAALTSTTFTNDTIDFTVAEWSIGASAAGANFVNGDIYSVWLDETIALDFSSAALRQKFITTGLEPLYLGDHGEIPLAALSGAPSMPRLFLAYDRSTDWTVNKGSATGTFTINGSAAVPAVAVTNDEINLIALLYHNASQAATVRVRGATSLANLTASPGYDSGTILMWDASWPSDQSPLHLLHWLGTATKKYTFWRLDITDSVNPDGYIEAGRLYIDEAWQLPQYKNISYGWAGQFIDPTTQTRSKGGQLYSEEMPAWRNLQASIDWLNQDEMYGSFYDIQRRNASKIPVLVIINPDATTHLLRQSIYGKLTQLQPMQHAQAQVFRTRLLIEEML